MWFLFWIAVIAALFVDLVILNNHGNLKTKSAAVMMLAWVGFALLFGFVVCTALGHDKALEYITSYIVEYSLSMDNMFVFLMIFKYFNIPKNNQPKVLIYGTLGAVILRFIFIFAGVQLINALSWIIYVFGALLIYTASKMILQKNEEGSPEKNVAYKILKNLFRFKFHVVTAKFFVKENAILYATPMLAAVAVIEISDIILAIDSVPVVLSISRDTFIVYTSNIFAIIGLRSLYSLLSNLAAQFKFLQTGVTVILFFVGLKMLLSNYIHISTSFSLGIIITILATSIVLSYIYKISMSNRKLTNVE